MLSRAAQWPTVNFAPAPTDRRAAKSCGAYRRTDCIRNFATRAPTLPRLRCLSPCAGRANKGIGRVAPIADIAQEVDSSIDARLQTPQTRIRFDSNSAHAVRPLFNATPTIGATAAGPLSYFPRASSAPIAHSLAAGKERLAAKGRSISSIFNCSRVWKLLTTTR